MSIRALEHLNRHPGPADLRRFALAMLGGFVVLGLLAAWRRHDFGSATWSLWAIGASLAVAALIPGLGPVVYVGVNAASAMIGFVVSHVLLTAIYFALFAPLGWLLRLFGKDLLQLRPPRRTPEWIERDPARSNESYYRGF